MRKDHGSGVAHLTGWEPKMFRKGMDDPFKDMLPITYLPAYTPQHLLPRRGNTDSLITKPSTHGFCEMLSNREVFEDKDMKISFAQKTTKGVKRID